MPRMHNFILKAILGITSGLSTHSMAEDGVPFETAKAIGRRVAWTAPLPGGEVRHSEQLGNHLYVLDKQNFLSSLNLDSGRIMWSVQVTGPDSSPDFIHTFEMRRGQGLAAKVTPMVLVGLGSELLKFDGSNGAMTKRVSMDRLPDTNPIEVGKYMVFGTNRGVVQWYNPDLEVPWRAFDCGDAMACDVSAGGDLLVAAARDKCIWPPPTATFAVTTTSIHRSLGSDCSKVFRRAGLLSSRKTATSPSPEKDSMHWSRFLAMSQEGFFLGSQRKQMAKSLPTMPDLCCCTTPRMASSGWFVGKMVA